MENYSRRVRKSTNKKNSGLTTKQISSALLLQVDIFIR